MKIVLPNTPHTDGTITLGDMQPILDAILQCRAEGRDKLTLTIMIRQPKTSSTFSNLFDKD